LPIEAKSTFQRTSKTTWRCIWKRCRHRYWKIAY